MDLNVTRRQLGSLPKEGAYLLILHMGCQMRIMIASLGELVFRKGYYVYVGSARRALPQRVTRHISREKRLRWHIDWLTSLKYVQVRGVAATSRTGVECDLANALAEGATGWAPRFGSTNCGCLSHLYHFTNYRTLLTHLASVSSLLGLQASELRNLKLHTVQ